MNTVLAGIFVVPCVALDQRKSWPQKTVASEPGCKIMLQPEQCRNQQELPDLLRKYLAEPFGCQWYLGPE